MSSNKVRREVAARLRANAMLGPNVLFDLHEAVGDGTYTQAGLAYCLADLIDRPTCRIVGYSIDHGSRSWGVRCDACGAEFEHQSGIGWKYCPVCGAEVAE